MGALDRVRAKFKSPGRETPKTDETGFGGFVGPQDEPPRSCSPGFGGFVSPQDRDSRSCSPAEATPPAQGASATGESTTTRVANVAGVAVAARPTIDLRADFREALIVGLETNGARGLVTCASCRSFRPSATAETDGRCVRHGPVFAFVPFQCPDFERASSSQEVT